MGQSMAVSTLLRRVGRLLTNPSEGDQLVFIGKGDRKPPKQVDMGNSGQRVRNVYGITEVGSWTAGALDASVPPTDGFIGPGWGAKIAVMPEEAGESGPQGSEPHTSDFSRTHRTLVVHLRLFVPRISAPASTPHPAGREARPVHPDKKPMTYNDDLQ